MEGRDGHILYAWRAEIPFSRPSDPVRLEGGEVRPSRPGPLGSYIPAVSVFLAEPAISFSCPTRTPVNEVHTIHSLRSRDQLLSTLPPLPLLAHQPTMYPLPPPFPTGQ